MMGLIDSPDVMWLFNFHTARLIISVCHPFTSSP
jgi:hypothetical protein